MQLSLTTLATAAGLALSVFPTISSAQGGDTKRQAGAYTDVNTGISFYGWSDSTGYRFGMVMPQQTQSDFIVQLVSPLNSNGAGWAGIDFGASMVGPLQIVAWPNGKDTVVVAPRVSAGYKARDTTPYSATAITVTPIAKGTFVNATHVSATFVCGGCINKDSFSAADVITGSDGSRSFSFAYSLVAVPDPTNINTGISDHTSQGEPYGSFAVSLKDAQSAQYTTFAALAAKTAAAGGTGSANTTTGTGTGGGTTAGATTQAGGGGGGGTATEEEPAAYNSMPNGAIAALALAGILYLMQAFSIF